MEKDKLVRIVIPVYRSELKPFEQAALSNNMEKLGHYPVVFLKPDGVDLSPLLEQYPQADVLSVSDDWLGTRRGIQGYNDMMMSRRFYDMFADYEYIMICHVDAWIFRDEVADWCRRGYDLVAAPWPMKPRYGRFPLKQYLWLKRVLKPHRWILHSQMFNRIGNGGLCLRRVQAFADACDRYADDIDYFNSRTDDLHNEDLFWALVPKEFHYPDVKTALTFAFDLKPRLSYVMNHRQLPMGCHGFDKKSRRAFWQQFIPIPE